ncbi:MAG TPA: hypothetical protein DCE43_23205 [Planctomycetaceae bacterium]|jgi:acylglycerol lipase|nr:hypothetical protein [Planctomycetaceae bacterium]
MIEAEYHEFVASDGRRLSWQRWLPSSAVRGYVVALHGIQSHGGWYEHSSRRLAEAGFEVCFLDRRGSGRNSEARGDAIHADRLVNDVRQFLVATRSRRDRDNPGAPVVLQAVSWGGKLAAIVASRCPGLVDGLALLYPGLKSRIRPGWWARFRLDLARRLEIRDKLVDIPLQDPALFTGDPDWQQFIRDDPLSLHEVTVGFLLANQDLDQQVDLAVTQVECPLLLMLAGGDRIIDNVATRELFQRFSSDEKRLLEYADAEHTLEFESSRDAFVADLLGWLEQVIVDD